MNYAICIIWNTLQPVNKDKGYVYAPRNDLHDILRATQHQQFVIEKKKDKETYNVDVSVEEVWKNLYQTVFSD